MHVINLSVTELIRNWVRGDGGLRIVVRRGLNMTALVWLVGSGGIIWQLHAI